MKELRHVGRGRERDFFNERGRKIQAEKIQRLSYLLMSIVVIGCNPQAKLSSMIVSFITKKKLLPLLLHYL